MNTAHPPPAGPVPNAPIEVLQNLWRDLWRYKWVVPTVAALVAGVVAFHTTRQQRIYEAVTTLEYDPHPAQPLGHAIEDPSSPAGNYWDSYEFYETQNYVLKSRGLAELVVRKLGLHQDPGFMSMRSVPRSGNVPSVQVEDAAQALLGRIRISQIRDTRIVTIAVEDGVPERAQLIANAYAEAYIDKSLEDRLGSSARALEWLGGQMQTLKRELEESELALYKFREENQSLSASLEERQKIIASQLQAYSGTLTEIRTKRVQTEAHLSVLRELLGNMDDPLELGASALATDDAIQGLREMYRAATGALAKLSVTYGPAHPQVQTAQAEVDMLAKHLRSQISSIVMGAEADLRELSRAEQGIQQALAEVNQQGLELSLHEIEYTRLDRERRSKVDLYALVMERAAQTDLTRALRVANARVVDKALKPGFAVRPRVRSAVATALALGLILGVLVALGVAQLDNKVRSVPDLESRGLTVLGVIPSFAESTASAPHQSRVRSRAGRNESSDRDLVVHLQPRSTVAECCRTIRTNLTFQSADRPLRTLAVTSAMPRDGKTTVSISLGITLAQSGRRVLLVDTDLRKPRLHRAFKLPSGAGITSVLAGEATLHEVVQATDVPGLTLLQCGPIPPNPSELLHTRRFTELVDEARNAYDIVVFDSPPLGAVTDPAIISTYVDGMILVIRARSTSRAGVDAGLRQLRGVSARIIGAVLNDVDLNESAYGSYYAYYRGYYAEPDTDDSAASRAARTST